MSRWKHRILRISIGNRRNMCNTLTARRRSSRSTGSSVSTSATAAAISLFRLTFACKTGLVSTPLRSVFCSTIEIHSHMWCLAWSTYRENRGADTCRGPGSCKYIDCIIDVEGTDSMPVSGFPGNGVVLDVGRAPDFGSGK